jgi:hypothetical protein
MISTTSIIIFGIIAIIAVVVIWKFWKKPNLPSIKNEEQALVTNDKPNESEIPGPPSTSSYGDPPTPMVFAVNDGGNLDLSDISGKLLNISYGPNPKVYINLLDLAEKDTSKVEGNDGNVYFQSTVGTTKNYEVGGRPYIINYTRL